MKLKITLLLTFLMVSSISFGQEKPTWNSWNWILGEWVGEGNGQPGQGGGKFSFSFDLDKKIIVRKSHSEYTAGANKGVIIHDDLMIIYLDFNGEPTKAIYFDNEGHTIDYQITYSDKSIIFISNKIPNVPIFRLTYLSLNKETINTKFEMSQDGENFTTYIEGKSKRVDKLNQQ